jgi:hypothetical protein
MDTVLVMQQQQEEQVVERGAWRWLCLFVGLAKDLSFLVRICSNLDDVTVSRHAGSAGDGLEESDGLNLATVHGIAVKTVLDLFMGLFCVLITCVLITCVLITHGYGIAVKTVLYIFRCVLIITQTSK